MHFKDIIHVYLLMDKQDLEKVIQLLEMIMI